MSASFELKHPSSGFTKDLAAVINAAPAQALPCCKTRQAILADALRIATWEFDSKGSVLVWLTPDGSHKVEVSP